MSERPTRQTHHIERTGDEVIKAYRSWSRDEHRREWWVLNQLATHAPGLAPQPIRADLEGNPPSITMSALAGSPIAERWDDHRLDLLADAMGRLWAVPVDDLTSIGFHRADYWRELAGSSARPDGDVEQEAYECARQWIDSDGLDALFSERRDLIIGQGDPQVGNLLFDGARIQLVDFEDAGASDICFELANFAEHLGTRAAGLDRLANRFDVDERRYLLCRRLVACFWLFRLGQDPRRGVEMRDQAKRLLALFG
jgi:Ser/Thr protein kinase RdoA (MazF antagonist)